jgi:WD repeat-containing protein 6
LLHSYEGDNEIIHLGDNQYMTVHLGRLKEHEGSIFRIAWSSDGSKFMSVSDDRRLVCFDFGSHCLHQESFCFIRLPFMILLAHLILLLCGSARLWMLSFKSQSFVSQTASQDSVEIIPKLTLFGHSARIWDCYVSDSVSCHTLFPLLL